MIKTVRTIYYSCENKKYYTNRLYKKICNKCLNVNINNMNKCIYCDGSLNDENIRLIKNDVYTDIINVRKLYKADSGHKTVHYFEKDNSDKGKEIGHDSMLLMNTVEIDDKYVYLKNREINNCKKLYVYYNCYDYIILNNPYSLGSINLIILFKGILYDMKNLKRKHLSCLLHVYNYINCIIDVFLFYLLIGKGKTVHYKQMSVKSNENKKEFCDYNEEILEIILRLNQAIKERKENFKFAYSKNEKTQKVNKKSNEINLNNMPSEYQQTEQVSECNIIEHLNKNYENIYKDIFKKKKDPMLFEFYKKLEHENIKKKIAILKRHLYIGCSYPSPINHFSAHVLFPPFPNFNFFTFPFYFPIQRIIYHLYLYGHVKSYSDAESIKNIYTDTLLRHIKESDVIVRNLLQF